MTFRVVNMNMKYRETTHHIKSLNMKYFEALEMAKLIKSIAIHHINYRQHQVELFYV